LHKKAIKRKGRKRGEEKLKQGQETHTHGLSLVLTNNIIIRIRNPLLRNGLILRILKDLLRSLIK